MYLTANQREKNILINNVREQQFENSGQHIAIVKKIVKNIDKNVTVTRAYRTGEQPGNSQKNRPIAFGQSLTIFGEIAFGQTTAFLSS